MPGSGDTGELVEMYIKTLYVLAEHFEFREKRDEHIRDPFVGIKDKELSQWFQLMANLTVVQVIKQVHQAEEITKQVSLQNNQPEAQLANVNVV